jgi:diguanylate cyclase (GGDEF)-like protein/PAS domain S-box-containing protein
VSTENKQHAGGGDSVTNLIEDLSRRAEAALSQRAGPSPEAFAAPSPEAARQLLHDLQVHQIELEMQNEELRRTHTALEASRSHYFDFYDLASVGYCTVTEKGLIKEVNLTTCALLNVPRNQLIKQPIGKFIFNDDQSIYYGLRHRLRDSGESLSCELRLLQRDDTPFWAHLVVSAVQDDDGVTELRMVLSDITERKQAEQALRESESFKSSILDSLDAEFAIVDRSGLILDVNQRWRQFSLESSKEPGKPAPRTDVGTNYLAVCAVAGTAGGLEAGAGIQSVLEGRLPRFRLEYRCDSPQLQRWFLMSVMPLGDDAKDGAVIMHTDISERKQVQAVDAFLAQAGSSPGVEPFFDALAKFLAQNLQMDYICIDRLEGDKLNATTLAVWHDGQFEDNLTYALRDTPCGDVVGQQVCCFPASVRQFFPNDAALQELHAESYIGVTLWSHTGQPIGLIAAIGRRELSNREVAEATLARVVVRASGELERLNAEAATYRSETRFRGVFEKSYAGIAVADATGTLLEVNDNLARMLEYERQELIGMNIAQFTHLDDLAVERVYLNEMRAGQRDEYRMNKRYLTRTGALIWVDLLVTVVRNLEGNAVNVIGLVVDIRERMKAEAKLQLAASVFSHAREGIIITDVKGSIIDINEAFTRITGYGREEVLGQSPRILKSGRQDKAFYDVMWRDLTEHGHWSGEIWNRRQDGETYAELLTISSVRDAAGVVQQYVGLFSDITAIKQHQSQLEHIAHFDALTSLPNRVLLADRLQQAMAQAQRREHHLAVVYLDLDGFKAINDRHGHDAGDQVLITLAQRMKQVLREGDSLARLGGDEFVAVLIDLEDQSSSRTMLTRLLAACAQSIQVGEHSLQVSASLGVTFYPQEQEIDADQLLRQADQAMYQAKLAGKSRYHMFDATLDSSIRGHHESVERIRLALEMREFVLHYQPKVNMRSGQIIGAEALIRWQHPEKGLLLPAVFLPVIEDHALAVFIGEWVIDTALTQIELWRSAGLDMKVSVNIGARQLQQSDFVERLKSILAKHPQVDPTSLELEVLETSALEDFAQVSQVIEDCAQIGVTFALDDFGTGYSSLTYLKRLRVQVLKIDQSFVGDMLEDSADWAILQGIIGMAAAFKQDVIAEGVETIEHGSLLLQLGCILAQGYGIARPMPAAQMPKWATEWQPDAAWDSVWDNIKAGNGLNGIERRSKANERRIVAE